MRIINRLLIAILGLLMAGIYAVRAQEESEVPELTAEEVTSEALEEALLPETAPPPELWGTRGDPSGETSLRVRCDRFSEMRSRGMTVKPKRKVVAVEILFASGSADLVPRFSKTLDTIGEALTSGALSPCCFLIEGHTDSQGSKSYNRALSRRRARTVVDYLIEKFDIDPQRLSQVGHGEERPIAENRTAEGRRRNRRVQIVNLGYGEIEQ